MWKVDLKIFFKESWKKYGFVFLLVLVQCVGFRNPVSYTHLDVYKRQSLVSSEESWDGLTSTEL